MPGRFLGDLQDSLHGKDGVCYLLDPVARGSLDSTHVCVFFNVFFTCVYLES